MAAGLFNKVKRKIKRLRLHPIHVFLFHQVSVSFDESTMKKTDWTEINQFKRNIEVLKKRYIFIPLSEAYERIRNDRFRFKDFAVLTSDDGWASLMNILPWLHEEGVPVTLFLNPSYLDGISFREKNTERYLTKDSIEYLARHDRSISFGSHGWNHSRVTSLSEEEFRYQVNSCITELACYHSYVPFFAYPYGIHDSICDSVLHGFGLVPVLIDNDVNISDKSVIHRELIDGKEFVD